ncbi:DUF4397 domain-containing protein [Mucilaginibacter sp. JRF]|uniref:DUF4397 domain-containing protein n=1 Tax=Mucilaginibacter sp. JRF TaxID=2780088 RepID=UPI0018805B1B|nr:DUF4397 domain-containing protein [Mucilaginibacter sp. JRF]MBE9586241.1 DUF4397 domain-containing protein [Mucilaginibacter sp. JRF]
MKKTRNFSNFFLKPAVGLLGIALMFTACSDDDNVSPAPGVANLAVVHAAPGSPELSLSVNGTKSNIKKLTFGTFIGYANINEGNAEFSITKKDSTKVLTKSTAALKSGKYYSLIIADVPAKTAFTLVEDDLTAPAADKAKVRFVNLSPDGGSLDLSITGQTTPLYTKTAFKAATAFTAVTPGAELNFEIRENTKPEVLAKIEKVKIEKGKIYTIWAKGLKAATDSTKLSLGVITNK